MYKKVREIRSFPSIFFAPSAIITIEVCFFVGEFLYYLMYSIVAPNIYSPFTMI